MEIVATRGSNCYVNDERPGKKFVRRRRLQFQNGLRNQGVLQDVLEVFVTLLVLVSGQHAIFGSSTSSVLERPSQ